MRFFRICHGRCTEQCTCHCQRSHIFPTDHGWIRKLSTWINL
jgi:hypothetical protein